VLSEHMKGGNLRMRIDCRALNNQTVNHASLVPGMEEHRVGMLDNQLVECTVVDAHVHRLAT
jgi:hypothetical protein